MEMETKEIRTFLHNDDLDFNDRNIRISRNIEIDYDNENRKILNGYLFLKRLYKSESAKIVLAQKNKKLYAVKIINRLILSKKKKSYTKDDKGFMKIIYMIDDALSELNIIKLINNENHNIIRTFEIIEDDDALKTYIVMEFASFGTLIDFSDKSQTFYLNSNVMKNPEYIRIIDQQINGNDKNNTEDNHIVDKKNAYYSEEYLKKFIKQISEALEYLHSRNIVHRDIKTDNILVTDTIDFKLIDFNRSQVTDESDSISKTEGNYFFYAPECCQNKGSFKTKPVDIWALGVTLFVACYKKLPFIPKNTSNYLELFNMIGTKEIEFPEIPQISNELRDFYSKILNKEPEQRIKVEEIKNHIWVKAVEE